MENLDFGLSQLFIRHRAIRSAKVDGSRQKLADAPSRSNGLVVDFDVRVAFVVFVKPLGIDGIRECGPGAVDEKFVRGIRY
jgi:hypothetical protein